MSGISNILQSEVVSIKKSKGNNSTGKILFNSETRTNNTENSGKSLSGFRNNGMIWRDGMGSRLFLSDRASTLLFASVFLLGRRREFLSGSDFFRKER
jgi:hypothetical protein